MTSPSLSRRVLELVDSIDNTLGEIQLEMAAQWPASTTALLLASSNLRAAALIRLDASERESARRSSSPTGTVMDQRGPRD